MAAIKHKQENLEKYKFLLFFIVSQVIFIFLFAIALHIFKQDIPAPKITISESFNEKARWLKNNITKNCDILVLGSSVALNNIDWSTIEENLSKTNVLNTASWGLTIKESTEMFKTLAPICKPKLVILTAYFGDFLYDKDKTIDWNKFKDYLLTDYPEKYYFQEFDLNYYITQFIKQYRLKNFKNRKYQSLDFDNTGTVIFNCDNFLINDERWNGFNHLEKTSIEDFNKQLQSLHEFGNSIKQQNIKFILINTPIREEGKLKIKEINDYQLWEKVIAAIEASGGIFINPEINSQFTDSDFADYAHLNSCGAKKIANNITLPISLFFPTSL